MNHDSAQSQRLCSIELVDEGSNRLLPEERQGSRQVDQVAGVRDNRRESGFIDTLTKPENLVGSDRLPEPLVGVLAEDLQGLAAVHERAIDCLRDSPGDRHVRANSHDSPMVAVPPVFIVDDLDSSN
jgi:hypothetical protein